MLKKAHQALHNSVLFVENMRFLHWLSVDYTG